MKHRKKISFVFALLMISFLFSGCTSFDKLKVKLGLKNNDFEYLNEGKVKSISIQNTRDKGFTFIISDTKTISELYDILSTAKVVKTKSSLEPDYTIKMIEGTNKTVKYSYVVGIDRKDAGNFYSNNKVYMVSKNIDTNIIKNFGVISEPRNFKDIYYESILQTIDKYKNLNKKNVTMGVNLKDDINGAKYIFSTELEDFKSELSKKGAELVSDDKKYNVIFTVKTEGYREKDYKSIIQAKNTSDNTEKVFYVVGKYASTEWDIKIYADKMPANFE